MSAKDARERANTQFGAMKRTTNNGGALEIAAADAEATRLKTMRLRALRLAKEAADGPAPPPAKPRARRKAT